MAKALIIVESPAKIKTLKNFLSSDYKVEASMGHVRDLPKSKIGVDTANDFAPTYTAIPERKEVLRKLAAAAKDVDIVYLASDPDREGEAIAWHLMEALKLKSVQRIQFNEITQTAVRAALQNPRTVNMDRVNAQQARRVLDRLIGYKLSPILSAKIQRGLSAGRVQSVALRLVCEREREILAFVPEEYWSLTALLTPSAPAKKFQFAAKLHSRAGQKLEPKSAEDIDIVLHDLDGAKYSVADVKKREQKRNASAPFITSTLQQEASRKLGFGNRRTMSVAQDLYEGIEIGKEGSVGLITYMRTDSVRVANEAQEEARAFIAERYGNAYVPASSKQFKTKGNAQDAHEAIRPTSTFRDPDSVARYLNADQLKLYRLIWQRFVASQMNPAILDVTTVDVNANLAIDSQVPNVDPRAPYIFRASGTVIKFDGFMRVYMEGKDTEEVSDEEQPPLPALSKDQPLDLLKLEPKQHFTEPPPRYTEATIVKGLEERGIGRPSTYANIISTIRDREYVELREKKFYPTELGFKVNDQLVKHFPDVMNYEFTADMELRLDAVEEGGENWVSLVRGFYTPFEETLKAASKDMVSMKAAPIETEFHCPDTGKVMLLREGRFGQFMGCSGYPECKKILKMDEAGQPIDGANFICGLKEEAVTKADPASLPNATAHVCPSDNGGVMLVRQSRFGAFLGCSNYPKCRTSLKIDTEGNLLPDQAFACTYSEKATKGKRGAVKKTTTTKTTAKGKATTTRKPTTAKTATVKAAPKRRAAPKVKEE